MLKKDKEEADRLTAMQMYVLENLSYNLGKGGIIMGGAGTGKTILALELLKKKVREGLNCLLVCYNKNLAEYLRKKSQYSIADGQYEVSHLHGIYHDRNYISVPSETSADDREYWSQNLPLHFVRHLSENRKAYFDYIIIDEGQDILNEYHFEALGKLLKGGLESGNWALYMDKDFQNIYNESTDEYFIYLREVYPCFINMLQVNCRNTESAVKRASVLSGFPLMPCLRVSQSWNSTINFYSSRIDLRNRITDLIMDMEKDGISRKDITILCAEREQLNYLIQSDPDRYRESAFEVPGKISICTIHAYKGLENRFVIICGPADYNPSDRRQMSLIYIAGTRATTRSISFIDIKYKSIVENRIAEMTA